MFNKVHAAAAAIMFTASTAAFGQVMVGEQSVEAGDLPAVEAHCAMLATGGTESNMAEAGISGNPDTAGQEADADAAQLGSTANEAAPEGNAGNPSAEADAATEAATGDTSSSTTEQVAVAGNSGNPDAEEASGGVNLQQITLAECEAAGL
ncbi:hypothetical protein H4P12_13820 [Paracoccus sp. 11-3]|uniref:HdeA/HdeB family protein n=1 Tax=Paracoccus amoyensis TaxID=2760093 RepID=A0A926GI92_9RHOB|nr:hypothetical protein [Paracoccus amoyensis]MBC9247754.1 hypothetical protein [Paracoccus amoyensis]